MRYMFMVIGLALMIACGKQEINDSLQADRVINLVSDDQKEFDDVVSEEIPSVVEELPLDMQVGERGLIPTIYDYVIDSNAITIMATYVSYDVTEEAMVFPLGSSEEFIITKLGEPALRSIRGRDNQLITLWYVKQAIEFVLEADALIGVHVIKSRFFDRAELNPDPHQQMQIHLILDEDREVTFLLGDATKPTLQAIQKEWNHSYIIETGNIVLGDNHITINQHAEFMEKILYWYSPPQTIQITLSEKGVKPSDNIPINFTSHLDNVGGGAIVDYYGYPDLSGGGDGVYYSDSTYTFLNYGMTLTFPDVALPDDDELISSFEFNLYPYSWRDEKNPYIEQIIFSYNDLTFSTGQSEEDVYAKLEAMGLEQVGNNQYKLENRFLDLRFKDQQLVGVELHNNHIRRYHEWRNQFIYFRRATRRGEEFIYSDIFSLGSAFYMSKKIPEAMEEYDEYSKSDEERVMGDFIAHFYYDYGLILLFNRELEILTGILLTNDERYNKRKMILEFSDDSYRFKLMTGESYITGVAELKVHAYVEEEYGSYRIKDRYWLVLPSLDNSEEIGYIGFSTIDISQWVKKFLLRNE